MNAIFKLVESTGECHDCARRPACLPKGMAGHDIERFEAIVRRPRVVAGDAHLFMAGEPCDALYFVRSGSFKKYIIDDEGNEQVLGFYYPGDRLGLDALGDGYHHSTAMALEISSVCALPVKSLDTLDGYLHQLYARKLARSQAVQSLLARRSAEQRLAGFLLQLVDSFAARGLSRREFNLSMSRHDIANHLALALETVSRLFTQLENERMLEVDRRHIVIRDEAALQRRSCSRPYRSAA